MTTNADDSARATTALDEQRPGDLSISQAPTVVEHEEKEKIRPGAAWKKDEGEPSNLCAQQSQDSRSS